MLRLHNPFRVVTAHGKDKRVYALLFTRHVSLTVMFMVDVKRSRVIFQGRIWVWEIWLGGSKWERKFLSSMMSGTDTAGPANGSS